MRKVIYPGTFDPITLGHLDIIQRASCIFDKVIVAVVKVPSKQTMFSFEERLAMVKEATVSMQKIEVQGFTGLVVDFAQTLGIHVIVRGLRMISDFEYEFQMALTNRRLNDEIETIFLMPHPEYSYISSRLIKEAAQLGASLSEFLPPISAQYVKEKLNK
ncbi:MAG: pantetheine-phosphate adenylyltransferase [Candidatus Omnitrophica bacterium]|nr:pantetheine-phosphate adenylyltransferase [Candidatus Omnitrophota bacterium]